MAADLLYECGEKSAYHGAHRHWPGTIILFKQPPHIILCETCALDTTWPQQNFCLFLSFLFMLYTAYI